MLVIPFIFACSSRSSVNPEATQVIEENEVVQKELNGTFPPEALPLIDFTATNYDGSERGRDHLVGHPTVIWFYPRAQTAG